jgi:ribosomal protein S18 acetylase RimI-like enzyme
MTIKYLWKQDKFDSQILGLKAAKIIDLNPTRVKNLIYELIKSKIQYAIYRVKSSNYSLIHTLEQNKFLLVDGLICMSLDISSFKLFIEPKIREAGISDLLSLKKLTSNLYSGTRITNDPLFSKEIANKYYLKWIENSIKGESADLVLVWEENGKILGYVTLQKKGQIPLLGVSKNSRGRGIAKNLLFAALSEFKKWGVEKINIDTQMDNFPALKTYQRVGFKIVDSYLTFRWTR